ncbi:GmrSD restriction endonuclease domain-containing protein [Vibrio parahaemolyticus]|uniref:GmrSD restriction endonuclease domain-containing protein n=1 Tax=Vibrio parahaemolyticus TaxID=670 RepID=UPI00356B66CE
MKDKPFEIKQAAFKESEFAETKELSKIDGWSEEEIKKRAKKLSKLALNIWPAF